MLWITRTAALIALLIVFQWGLGALTGGNQYVVGSAVNLKFAIPQLLTLPEAKVNVLSLMFSWPQLVTAAIGGVLALLVIPALQKAVSQKI